MVEVLPTMPVMPTTAAQAAHRPGCQRHQRRGGVVDLDRRDRDGRVGRARRQIGAGPGVGRRRDEVVTVTVGDDRHEQLTRRHEP